MKYRHVYIIIFFIISVILSATGCPRSVGKCTYGKEPVLRGTVVIKSIEKEYSDNQLSYRIKVEGVFKRDFIYTEEDFQKEFTSKGYKTGSVLEGIIISGGPCPPIYRLTDVFQ